VHHESIGVANVAVRDQRKAQLDLQACTSSATL
jgi:hypothetical protein